MQICSFWCKFLEHIYLLYNLSSASVMVEPAHTCVSSMNAFILTRQVLNVGGQNVLALALALAHMGGLIDARICGCLHAPQSGPWDSLIRSTHSVI